MEAFSLIEANIEFDVFSNTQPRFFELSLSHAPVFLPMETDVGLSQIDPFNEDISKTIGLLDYFYPLQKERIEQAASRLLELGCSIAVCDISPLGIAAAAEVGIPSVLIENFTWDWIYKSYLDEEPRLEPHIEYLEKIFSTARYRIKTAPACFGGAADLTVTCVSRVPGRGRHETREMLGIGEESLIILLTVGGMEGQIAVPIEACDLRKTYFLFPGQNGHKRREGNLIFISGDSELFYPDLVASSDLIIGKIGYSTLAEAYNCGIPYGYVIRKRFPESWLLASFLEDHKRGAEVEEKALRDGTWLSDIDKLLSLGRRPPRTQNGALDIARFLLSILEK